ncbi:hypothetical protein E2562_002193 [Oryza meyeriana var. granulata]|uniref:Uncharacterized protein n=1 Tax=Oryza meyeriana var. granulata TaxID=110450 RepID=A0A6G1EGA1_9ORYZ|nr:hypothetical protein E2562_002193 [Oryza meyeriana var. granulata]
MWLTVGDRIVAVNPIGRHHRLFQLPEELAMRSVAMGEVDGRLHVIFLCSRRTLPVYALASLEQDDADWVRWELVTHRYMHGDLWSICHLQYTAVRSQGGSAWLSDSVGSGLVRIDVKKGHIDSIAELSAYTDARSSVMFIPRLGQLTPSIRPAGCVGSTAQARGGPAEATGRPAHAQEELAGPGW